MREPKAKKFDTERMDENLAVQDEASAKRYESHGRSVSALIYRNEAYFRRNGMKSLTARETLDESMEKLLRRIG